MLPLQLALQTGLKAVQLLQCRRLRRLHSSSLALQRCSASLHRRLTRREVRCSGSLLLLLILQGGSCGFQGVPL